MKSSSFEFHSNAESWIVHQASTQAIFKSVKLLTCHIYEATWNAYFHISLAFVILILLIFAFWKDDSPIITQFSIHSILRLSIPSTLWNAHLPNFDKLESLISAIDNQPLFWNA